MLYKKVEHSKDKQLQWNNFVFELLLTYNNKLKTHITQHTPAAATKSDYFKLNGFGRMYLRNEILKTAP